ncbi:Hsp20/alpha crystallin family protein [Nocardiopsis eucommiae]|uniref:Hsp20/alpha crystallin family protein n=1 Tax=Nocardiopsis eucommiae TaxID=2831970 RepID=A0A975QLH6_9ACTN|nr:Hsp20/alpha crystallin family protein [Nocardiopsis eucommiae]
MNAVSRGEGLTRFPDPWDVDPPSPSSRTSSYLRVETSVNDHLYVVRVEAPGVDPQRDLKVTVERGTITIECVRTEGTTAPLYTEFHYGTFSRTLVLPAEADWEDVTASYDQGLLEVRVGLSREPGSSRTVPISRESPEE